MRKYDVLLELCKEAFPENEYLQKRYAAANRDHKKTAEVEKLADDYKSGRISLEQLQLELRGYTEYRKNKLLNK